MVLKTTLSPPAAPTDMTTLAAGISIFWSREARLATAEQYFSLGAVREAKVFAMRARELLAKNTPDWRRATDIVLASRPSNQELKDLAKESLAQSNPGL